MSNKVHMRIVSVMLTVWYCMSIIGFDVHTCSGSGRSFIATFVEGLSCNDIHPDHICDKDCCSAHETEHHACGCTSHHDASCRDKVVLKAASCCSNDYQSLSLTGTTLEDGRQFQLNVMPVCVGYASSVSGMLASVQKSRFGITKDPVPLFSARDVQISCNSWLI